MEILRRVLKLDENESKLRLVFAEALLGAGRAEEARCALAEAKAVLLARAEKIADANVRSSFMTSVAEHARILELSGHEAGPSGRLDSRPF